MKKIDKRHRPQPSKKLELQRETIRRLDAIALADIRGAAMDSFPTVPTRDDFI
ncbi:MAG TPA: hypothetical protein VNM90_16710 [Haliangium sp.]|nr:hypothetical protein [Haliangium sp.]